VEKKIKIMGFVGSLRKGSYNKALMRAAMELVPDNVEIEVFDLAGIPPFNQDLENQPPQILKYFKAKIKAADALLIATPEYNYSIPGVLKNAIDARVATLRGQGIRRQTRRRHECIHRLAWRCKGTVPPAPVICVSQHVPYKLP
jgi:multimeric flavodoxin WrbA